MVVFLHFYAEHSVFYGLGYAGKLDSLMTHIGMLPPEWKGRYNVFDKAEAKASWYGHSSQLEPKNTFSEFLDKHRPEISAKEKTLALSVIREVFRPKPEERIGASDLLKNEDFKALMKLYGISGFSAI